MKKFITLKSRAIFKDLSIVRPGCCFFLVAFCYFFSGFIANGLCLIQIKVD